MIMKREVKVFNVTVKYPKYNYEYKDIVKNTEQEAIEYVKELFSYDNNEKDFEVIEVSEKVYNFDKKVVDIYGEEQYIDENSKEIHDYSNKAGKVDYIAKTFSEEKEDIYGCEYVEDGKVEEIEDKLKTWNNPVKHFYAMNVEFNSGKNDKDKKIWNAYVDYVRNHEKEFFDKNGDWKQRIQAAAKRMEIYIAENK